MDRQSRAERKLNSTTRVKSEPREAVKEPEEFTPLEVSPFKTEEGRYLATTLGDPLIKGLTEVANQRPENPIIFLANFLQNYGNDGGEKKNGENLPDEAKQVEVFQNHSQSQPPTKPVVKNNVTAKTNGFTTPIPSPSPEELEDNGNLNLDRDEHGQSMLHFACARSHGRNALIQLIEESGVNIAYRDELYRTPRDVALQAGQPSNAKEIDRYVISLAARGDVESFQNLFNDGYDHMLDITDTDNNNVLTVAKNRNHTELIRLLESLPELEEKREALHKAIREGNLDDAKSILGQSDGSKLARAKNYFGRTSLHVAILKENEEAVDYIGKTFRQTLKIGDNLERTPLHYAMGVGGVELISRILVKNGAKRVAKDLKGRQPSYYFMNKADILRLQEEEEEP